MLKIKEGKIYVNNKKTTNAELIGLSLIDLLEDNPGLKIIMPTKTKTMKYTSISEIPYHLYLTIQRNPEKNYYLLTDKEEVSTRELAKNWKQLSTQFDKEFKKLMSEDFPINKFRIEMEFIKNKLNIINASIKSLQFAYSEELIEVLETFDIKISAENYSVDLDNLKVRNDLQIEFFEFLPMEIERFHLIDFFILFCLSTNKLKELNNLTVTEAFDLQREVIENLYNIN